MHSPGRGLAVQERGAQATALADALASLRRTRARMASLTAYDKDVSSASYNLSSATSGSYYSCVSQITIVCDTGNLKSTDRGVLFSLPAPKPTEHAELDAFCDHSKDGYGIIFKRTVKRELPGGHVTPISWPLFLPIEQCVQKQSDFGKSFCL
ncbi:hypothetical protein NN561_008037 [Cricetulus griseus]